MEFPQLFRDVARDRNPDTDKSQFHLSYNTLVHSTCIPLRSLRSRELAVTASTMFRKISENIISAAVSPFSSAPSTPAATESPSTLDINSLSIASSTSTNENTHQARAQVERQLADDLAKFAVPMSREDCFGCDDHQEGCDESEGAGHVTHVQYPRGFDVDWDSDLLASAKPQPRQVSSMLKKIGFPLSEER